ncbi:MAG: amidohydrolase [Phycisphaerales bacterium]|nr:amidohydrolase [Phycisphaerales bacterium]
MAVVIHSSRIFRNGRIWTGVATRPWAASVLVRDGVVIALDPSTAEIPAHCEVIDLGGGVLIPGLIDAHLHLTLGSCAMCELDLTACRSREEFEQRIRTCHAALPQGEWLVAHSWNEADWKGAAPDVHWLREAGHRPAVAWRMDRHSCVVNRAALDVLQIPASIEGGRIERDTTGAPTGLFQEAAAWRIVVPAIPELSNARAKTALLHSAHALRKFGLVAVGSMEYLRDLLNVHDCVRDQLPLRVHATVLDRDWPLDDALRNAIAFPASSRLRVIGMKAFVDGTLGSRTAAMLAPYADDVGNEGLLVELAKDGHLDAWLKLVRSKGLSPSMHAIGDRAAQLALDAADHARATLPERDASTAPRFEHMQTMRSSDIARMEGRFASMQPLHKADDARLALSRLGAARIARFFPFRTLINAGATLAFGSDWPIVSPDPLLGMRAAITGLDLEERPFATEQNLTVEEALTAYTINAARMLSLRSGVIAPTYSADFTLLDADPFAWDWHCGTPRVLATFVDGV